MGVWTRNSNNIYALSGAGRTALIAGQDMPADNEFQVQLRSPATADNVFALVLASKDGRSGYEIGLAGANLVIRSVKFGDPTTIVVHATAAHGLTSGAGFTLGIRLVNGTIEARLNGAAAANLTHTPTLFAGYRHFGFVSNVDGAKVIAAKVCTLISQTAPRDDVLCAACGGDGFIVDGAAWKLIRAGMFPSSGDVAMAEFNQKVYTVDGKRGWIIDPRALTVEPWIPTAGDLPGGHNDGTTTARLICVYRGRIWLGGMPEDPQNLFACAVNDPLNFDTFLRLAGTAIDYGGAFGLTPANIGRIGQPVTCLISGSRNGIIIGTTGSIWELTGDPTTGNPELTEILNGVGISGKDAVALLANGQMMAHTPQGVYLIPQQGNPAPLSQPVLTEQIDIDAAEIELYAIQMRRDPTRNQVHLFRTKRTLATPASALHFSYDERVGGFVPANGGWYPHTFSYRFGPTASTPEPYKGKIVWGTRNGYLMTLEPPVDGVAATDDGDPVPCRVPFNLLQAGKLNRETILDGFTVMKGEGTTVKYRIYGALTPERVYNPSGTRSIQHSGTIDQTRQRIFRKCRAPALLGELYNDDGTPFRVEDVDAVVTIGRMLTRRDLSPAAAPGAPCSPPYLPHTSGESSSGTIPQDTIESGHGYSSQFDTSIPTSTAASIPIDSVDSFPIGYTGPLTATLDNTTMTDPLGSIDTIDPMTIHPGTLPGNDTVGNPASIASSFPEGNTASE